MKPIIPELVQKFTAKLQEAQNLSIKFEYKSNSKLMKVLAFFSYPFNPKFMTKFITVVGQTIYVPETYFNSNSRESQIAKIDDVAHEAQHMIDNRIYKTPLYFFLYFFPQVLSILSFLVWFAFLNPYWLLWLLCLLFLLPIPSPTRYKIELTGYRTTLLLDKHVYALDASLLEKDKEMIIKNLSGPWYYFCYPFKDRIRNDLEDTSWETEPRYKILIDFIEENIISSTKLTP